MKCQFCNKEKDPILQIIIGDKKVQYCLEDECMNKAEKKAAKILKEVSKW